MTFGTLGELNWLAVLVGAIVYFALGALWYSPGVLGKTWMRSIGWDPGQTPPQMNAASYAGPFLGYLVAAIAVGMLAVATGTDSFAEGLVLGLVIGIGVAASLLFVTAVFDPKKPERATWFWVTAGYHFLGLVITSVILAVWQ